jgi:uncharacterized membrane protein YeaQ/YmgE (transglycosylase-associated protein family)
MPLSLALAAAQFEISAWRLRTNSLWPWILVGLIAGWLAGYAFRGRGFGSITDIALGVMGSLIGGWVSTNYGFMGGDFYYSFAAAAAGAVLLVALSRLFSNGSKS